jgi:hypothetical protein
MVRGGERRYFRADGVRGAASQRMEKRRCWFEGSRGGELRGAGVSSWSMECAPLLVRGSRARREVGTSAKRGWKWWRSNPSRHAMALHPFRVKAERRRVMDGEADTRVGRCFFIPPRIDGERADKAPIFFSTMDIQTATQIGGGAAPPGPRVTRG